MTCKECIHFGICKKGFPWADGKGGGWCEDFKHNPDFVKVKQTDKKQNTCPLAINNNCVPMGCSCAGFDVELCRALHNAYNLGYYAATVKTTAKLIRIKQSVLGRQNGKTQLANIVKILSEPEPPFVEQLRQEAIKIQIEQAEKYGAIID